jgi:hypothetical protein
MSALNTIAVASLLLGLQVAVAVADGPPKLDLAPTCDAAARFSISAGRDKEACLEDWEGAGRFDRGGKGQFETTVTRGSSAAPGAM